MSRSLTTVYKYDLAVDDLGEGPPVLLLPSEEGATATRPFAQELAATHRVLMPHHPGYDDSPLLPWKASVRDLAYLYSEVLDQEGLHGIPVVGSSLGAWAALELAALGGGRVASLTLLGPVGIKLGGVETADFVDVYAITPDDRAARAYHDPERGKLKVESLMTAEIEKIMTSREAFTNYVWEPYLQSHALRHHAARIKAPTLVVTGDSDRLVRDGYYAELAAFLPNARHVVLAECGHFPDIERPAVTATQFTKFVACAAITV